MDEKNGAANTPVKKSSNQDQSGERVVMLIQWMKFVGTTKFCSMKNV